MATVAGIYPAMIRTTGTGWAIVLAVSGHSQRAILHGWSRAAPESLIAVKRDPDGGVTLSRPLCVYPKKAVYDGKGNPDDADSFSCK